MNIQPSEHTRVPVIIGTGPSGLFISRALSSKKIDHVLIGKRGQSTGPRLGESLNGEGSLDLMAFAPEMKAFYLAKNDITFHVGQRKYASCDLVGSRYRGVATFCRLTGYDLFSCLLHVERVGFDSQLFLETTASPHCEYVPTNVGSIDYSQRQDRVERVQTDGGDRVEPSFVFDATNQAGLLPRLVPVARSPLGPPRRVVFAHFRARGNGGSSHVASPLSWAHSTTILKLSSMADGLEGVAWCIPLGNYVSVGVSVAEDDVHDDDSEMIARTIAGYERIGIAIASAFPSVGEIVAHPHQYYVHERAWSRNWVLVGGAYTSIWFTSSSGFGLGLAAARLAHRFVAEPSRTGLIYQRLCGMFQELHTTHDRLLNTRVSSDIKTDAGTTGKLTP